MKKKEKLNIFKAIRLTKGKKNKYKKKEEKKPYIRETIERELL